MYKLLFTIVLASATTVIAQRKDQEDRTKEARSALKDLEKRVEALPEPPNLTRRGLPEPEPAAVRLTRSLEDYIRLYDDLPAAGAKAARLLARTHLSAADVVEALAALKKSRSKEVSERLKKDDLVAEAELRARYGDHAGAEKLYGELLVQAAGDARADEWKRAGSESARVLEVQQRELAALGNKGNTEGVERGRALFRARRFAFGFPIHAESAKLLAGLIGPMKKRPMKDRIPYVERLIVFFPQVKNWAAATLEAARYFALEGEYEKALFHGTRLLERSEVLPAAEVGPLSQLVKEVDGKLDIIAARELEVSPKTKRHRHRHMMRLIRSGGDTETIREVAEAFIADYPTASQTDEIRFKLAETFVVDQPLEAITRFTTLASNAVESDYGFRALMAAAPLIEKESGQEAANTFLAATGAAYDDPAQKSRIGLRRAQILSDLEKWEEARDLLKPLLEGAPPLEKPTIAQQLAELEQKIGG